MTVHATRYDLVRLRLGQALVPAAVVLTIVWRRADSSALLVPAIALQAAALAVLLLSRRRVGRRELVAEKGRIRLGADGPKILSSTVRAWSWETGVARIYERNASWKLAAADDPDAMRSALAGVLGKPRSLQSRGSRRARVGALVAAGLGLAFVAAGFALNTPAFAFGGVPALVIGIATFGALSQKVAADDGANPGRLQ